MPAAGSVRGIALGGSPRRAEGAKAELLVRLTAFRRAHRPHPPTVQVETNPHQSALRSASSSARRAPRASIDVRKVLITSDDPRSVRLRLICDSLRTEIPKTALVKVSVIAARGHRRAPILTDNRPCGDQSHRQDTADAIGAVLKEP